MLKFKMVTAFFLLTLISSLLLEPVFTIGFYVAITIIYLVVVAYGTTVLSVEFFIPVKFKGDPTSGAIAITFDDGPVPEKTEKILSILKFYKVPAAFFCIGNRVTANAPLVKQIYDEGHLLGNHSYWHKNTFDLQSTQKILSELLMTGTAIEDLVGKRPNFFRPPYGVTNPMVARAIKKGNFTTVGWSVRSFDTVSSNREALFTRVTKSLKAGDIVLFHDYCQITLEILPGFLDHVEKLGLKIVRVDELLNENAYA